MATIQRPVKTYGTRSYVSEVAAAPSNQDPILANEVDADLDTVYSAWNGGVDAVNIKDGAVSRAKLSTTDVLPSLPPIPIATDANKTVVVNSAGNGLILGTGGTFVGLTPPATPQVGQLWWRSDPDGNLFIYYDDGNSKQFVPAVPSSVGPWSVSGSTVTPTDATKTVSVPGDAAGNAIVLGTRTVKARISVNPSQDVLSLLLNHNLTGPAADDPAKPRWLISLDDGNDWFRVSRVPASSSTFNALLTLDNVGILTVTAPGTGSVSVITNSAGGNSGVYECRTARGTVTAPTPTLVNDVIGQYQATGCYQAGLYASQGYITWVASENFTSTARATQCYIRTTPAGTNSPTSYLFINNDGSIIITGAGAQKSAGTTWSNPSDPRLKNDISAYAAGLEEICALEPIAYRLKADPSGAVCYGFDAAKVRDVFPECVTTTRMKLDPADEDETDDVLVFDMHPILVALVNAVKELAGKVGA